MDDRQADTGDARTLALAADLRVTLGKLIRRLREQASPGDMTLSQKSVLTRLERDGPATVTALALAEGVRQQSMGATVAALEAAGWVAGTPDPDDGRRTILSLTPALRGWVRVGRAAREDWLARAITNTFEPEEQEALAAAALLLKRLADS